MPPRAWTVSADVLLPITVTVQAESAEDAVALVEAMDPGDLHDLWGGDTAGIGVSVDYAEEDEDGQHEEC